MPSEYLVGVAGGLVLEEFGGRVRGGQAAGVAGLVAAKDPGQAEVGHLDAPADQQEVLRLDVAVLDADPVLPLGRWVPRLVQVVDPLRGVHQVLDRLGDGDPRVPLRDRFVEPVHQGPLGQLHRQDEIAVNLPGPEHRQQMGMTDVSDDAQGALLDRPGLPGQEDELQRHLEPARPARLPDFPEGAPAQPLDEPVARHGLRVRGDRRKLRIGREARRSEGVHGDENLLEGSQTRRPFPQRDPALNVGVPRSEARPVRRFARRPHGAPRAPIPG